MKPKLINNFLILLFLGAWVFPVTYYGLANAAPFWLPGPFRDKANVSRLFAKWQQAWIVYGIQIHEKGSPDFESIDERSYFPWQPFGYCSRFQRVMAFATKDQKEMLAHWLYDHLKSNKPKIDTVRFISFPEAAPPSDQVRGHYEPPEAGSVPQDTIHIVSEYSFPQ